MPEQSRDHITKENFVTAMRRSGSRTLTLERLEADIAAGAPVNADGTINILKYVAWIAKELGDDGRR
ncbi:MAG: hypothetical protein IJQ54_07125 [Kiritimatiellae bacterium]|nr:hypothetical protein [Kiritimatiellia bacterium]